MAASFKKVPRVKRGKDGKYPQSLKSRMWSYEKFDEGNFLYRIAKKCILSTGEILDFNENILCQIVGRSDSYNVVNLLSGARVLALDEHLRQLTDEEIEYWNSSYQVICGVKVPITVKRDD